MGDRRAFPVACSQPPDGFRATASFARPTKAGQLEPGDDCEVDPPSPDPVDVAREEGYARGYDAGLEAQRLASEAEASIAQSLRFNLGQIDEALDRQVTERLRVFALDLCMATLEPLAIDPRILDRRIRLGLSMLSRASDQPRLFVNPMDIVLVQACVPDSVSVSVDPALGRGDIRLEANSGGVEDGPQRWRQAISEALQL